MSFARKNNVIYLYFILHEHCSEITIFIIIMLTYFRNFYIYTIFFYTINTFLQLYIYVTNILRTMSFLKHAHNKHDRSWKQTVTFVSKFNN